MENVEINQIQGIVEYNDGAEWVFQFDNDEPVVFAWTNKGATGPGDVVITLKANSHSSITFMSPQGDKGLRLYSRPITEETIRVRDLGQ